MIYPSKKDWWAYLVGPVGGLLVCIEISLITLAGFGAAPFPPALFVLIGLALAGLGILVLWGFFSTDYEIRPSELIVRFGPLQKTISLDAIVEIAPKQNLLDLEPAWGFAWSMDRIHIKHRRPNGRLALPVKISPNDKIAFLRGAIPSLEVDADGVLRVRERSE